ncbi:MGMT family protein [Conexibacter sp. S30A1]|uniref:MGMT family protein n=1 Tax=Conexibacter sp. S30A1 TaxID=2937800 RepID=UPI00200FE219|nr:MGMT family protein [Conexibacter sp. S30A1]
MTPRPASLLFELPGGALSATPEAIEPDSFAQLGALELQHIERWLAAAPAVLGEELLVVTTQFAGFDKTKERSDILALDRAGRLVVIELKRDSSGSRQDLQALRYAAFSATLTLDDLLDLYAKHHGAAPAAISKDEALSRFTNHVTEGALEGIDEDTRPRIILVAKAFQVEVTATVLWLRETWGMDISCVELVPYSVDGKVLLSSSVRIPLPEASEYMVKRDQKRQKAEAASKISWEKAMRVMAAIPHGRWMSYQDLAVAAGGTPRAGMAVGQYLAKAGDLPEHCAHRVLRSDGSVSPGWQGDIGGPEEAQALLEAEGLRFDDKGRADPAKRYQPASDGSTHAS